MKTWILEEWQYTMNHAGARVCSGKEILGTFDDYQEASAAWKKVAFDNYDDGMVWHRLVETNNA